MSEALIGLSDAMADAVADAGVSLVRVEGRRRMPASGIIWSVDGLIVTAHHVVTRDENISVALADGERIPATLVGRDPATDLALLRVDASGLQAANWVAPDDLRVGHLVMALGRPGRTVQATLGIISALGESWRTPAGGTVDRYLQTDVVMYPGFSGGSLVTVDGRVAGLNTSALMRGVSLALPFPTVDRVAAALAEHGHIKQGYLGVGAQPVRLPDNLRDELNQSTGLLLASVESDSPAARGGLVLGDTIIRFDSEPVRNLEDLFALLSSDRVGKEVPVSVLRGGALTDLVVVVGERG